MMDLKTFGHLEVLQNASDGWMLNVGIIICMLDTRVRNARFVFKKRRQVSAGDITILVDRGGEHGTAVLFKPHRIIGPAPEEGDAKWCAADDHRAPPSIRCVTALDIAVSRSGHDGVALGQFPDAAL